MTGLQGRPQKEKNSGNISCGFAVNQQRRPSKSRVRVKEESGPALPTEFSFLPHSVTHFLDTLCAKGAHTTEAEELVTTGSLPDFETLFLFKFWALSILKQTYFSILTFSPCLSMLHG